MNDSTLSQHQNHKTRKQQTLDKIQSAINEIQSNNGVVTKKLLMETTGLSSGTFSKDYVKNLLERNKVCQYKDVKHISLIHQNQTVTINELEKKIQKKDSIIQDYEIQLSSLKKKNASQLDDLEKLRNEHELLLGKYQILLEYLDTVGADLSDVPIV